jgi:ATP-dependent 26S proteasome regulatory subunit
MFQQGELHMNVAIISLSSDLDDNRFLSCLQRKPRNSILLIEDVDSVKISTNETETSTTKTSNSGITLSSLLNALDGIIGQEGSVVFMTCNDTSKLPPALLRPGRIDLKLHMGLADDFQIRSMYKRFFDKSSGEEIEKLVKLLPKDEIAPAELQNFFMLYSLQQANKNICDGVDDFLEDVRKDREQARLHADRNKQKRDIYGNLAADGTPPPTPKSDEEEKADNDSKRIVINVTENGQLCLAQS